MAHIVIAALPHFNRQSPALFNQNFLVRGQKSRLFNAGKTNTTTL